MRKQVFGLAFLLVLLISAEFVYGRESITDDLPPDSRYLIMLQYATFDIRHGEPSMPLDLHLDAYQEREQGYYIVQFTDVILPEWKTALKEDKIEILGYIPNNAFLVRMTESQRAKVIEYDHVQWCGIFQPAYRIAPWMPSQQQGEIDLIVITFPEGALAKITHELESLRGEVISVDENDFGGTIRVRSDLGAVWEIAKINGVMWIEPWMDPELLNDVAREIMSVEGRVWNTYGLFGSDQIVAVADTGLDVGTNDQNMSADFRGRIVAAYARGRINDWSDPHGHGTHVAGSVLGNGSNSGSDAFNHDYTSSFAGVAPEAKMVFQSLLDANGGLGGIPNDLNELFQEAYDAEARIHTNSWGNYLARGAYTNRSWQADQFTWSHPDMLILFAAGNEGIDADSDGIVDEDSIDAPGTAKNVVTVGATENDRDSGGYNPGGACQTWGGCWPEKFPVAPLQSDRLSDNVNGLAAFSSRGPVDGNRIKPDLTAPGTNIISARSHVSGAGIGWGIFNNDYTYCGGTSMATPLVAGSAALLREYYVEQVGHVPSSALLRALLVNGANSDLAPGQYGTGSTQEIPHEVPNNVIGWGRVNVETSLFPGTDSSVAFVDVARAQGLDAQAQHTYEYTVHNPNEPLKLSLVWTDNPSTSVIAGTQLVNDLDIVIRMPDGRIQYPNGLTSPDRNNNTEVISLTPTTAITGTYRITVTGHNVPAAPQGYAVVVRGGLPFQILHPSSDGAMISPVYAGTHHSPNKITVEVTKPTGGLRRDDFTVSIGNTQAAIVTVYESSSAYILEVMPPVQTSDGLYDLTVSAKVGGLRIPTTQTDVVAYGNAANIDVALVIDRSGSMSDNNKMAAAKDAARQFIDLMATGDMVGVVSFDDFVETNFPLTVITPITATPPFFADDMESGSGNWSADAPWSLTTTAAHSPDHAWTDSPTGNYGNHLDIALRLATPVHIPTTTPNPALSFWQRYQLENNYDKGYIEASTDGGSNWQPLGDYVTGSNLTWHRMERDLTPYQGQDVSIRFRLDTDSSVSHDGWYIDDVAFGQSVTDVREQAKMVIDALYSRGTTSIGGGLQRGQEQLIARGAADHPWAMILLSDGQENSAPYVADVLPAISASKTIVHTVGLGYGADEALMLDIADQTGGTYSFSPSAQELSGIYNTIAGAVANRQTLLAASGSAQQGVTDDIDVVVDSTVSDATFSVTWANSGSTLELTLRTPSGQTIDPTAAANNANITYVAGATYVYYRITSSALETGAWTMQVTGGSISTVAAKGIVITAASEPYSVHVTGQSDLTLHLYLDHTDYLTGEPIKLIATLSDNQPLLSVIVTVQVQLASQTVRTVTLYDDGAHGDGAANDGVYAQTFGGVFTPGSYTFAAHAEGTSNLGGSFVRHAECSTYIALGADHHMEVYLPLVVRDYQGAAPQWSAAGLTGRIVYTLAFAPNNCAIRYAGTDIGLYRSTDTGATWSSQGLTGLTITSIAVDPTSAQKVYAASWGQGVYKSNDGGNTWMKINTGLGNNLQAFPILMAPDGSALYVSVLDEGVFKSANGGVSWSAANTGLSNLQVRALAVSPQNSQVVYAGTTQGVYKSTNAAASWSPASTGVSGATVWQLVVTGDTLVAATDQGIFRSLNAGGSWNQVCGAGETFYAVLFDLGNGQRVYAGSGTTGVYRSTDRGGQWTSLSAGLGNLAIQSLTLDGGTCRVLHAGTENGVWSYRE